MTMQGMDVDELRDEVRRCAPEFLPYAEFAVRYKDMINANSDGWSYWRMGRDAAKGLLGLLELAVRQRAEPDPRKSSEWVIEPQLRRALGPIRSLCTRKKLPCPPFGDAPTDESPRIDVRTHPASSPGTGLYRTLVVLEVLSDRPMDSLELRDLVYEITDGESSGISQVLDTREISRADMAAALERQGSDPAFLLGDTDSGEAE